jgi:hypothetical protein
VSCGIRLFPHIKGFFNPFFPSSAVAPEEYRDYVTSKNLDVRPIRNMIMRLLSLILTLTMMAACSCAYNQNLSTEQKPVAYVAKGLEGSPLNSYAPVFVSHGHRRPYNRIGQVTAAYNDRGTVDVFPNPEKPVIYYLIKKFSTAKGEYTNLLYRVQFPQIPFSIIPFHLSAGYNVGVMVAVTLDREKRPVLVTSVQTCGCYAAIIPTNYLSPESLPPKWKHDTLEVYGEKLPALIDYGKSSDPKLLVHLRPATHRVMNLEVVDAASLNNPVIWSPIQTPLQDMNDLERIPVAGGTTSFYYHTWPLKGHVKDSVKPWESLFLSIISLDFFVGADKAYADSAVTGNPFYTSLKPWNRKASNMWDFAGFLKFWGWRL